jgi:hypothetical protein
MRLHELDLVGRERVTGPETRACALCGLSSLERENGRGSHGPARYSAGPRRDEQTIFIEGTCEHDGVVRLEQSAIADVSDI